MVYKILILLIILFLIYNFVNKKEYFKNENTLYIIIPIRDREEDLKDYLKNALPVFDYHRINYKILIVEQEQGKKFNKAKINNVGFLEMNKKYPKSQRILFNDVDNYPLDKNAINFKCPIRGIHHFFGHYFCLGGIFLINKNDYIKLNGFSNNFWGWGGEDVDFQKRAEILGVKIVRDNFFERHLNKKVKKLKDNISKPIKKKFRPNSKKLNTLKNQYKTEPKIIGLDGLNNCYYKVIKRKKYSKNIERILVDI